MLTPFQIGIIAANSDELRWNTATECVQGCIDACSRLRFFIGYEAGRFLSDVSTISQELSFHDMNNWEVTLDRHIHEDLYRSERTP